MELDTMRQAVQQALKQTGPPAQPISQQTIWQNIRDDPNRLLTYVQRRTGQTGDGLLKEVMAYQTAMRSKYG